jgi:predicted dehydrogenase
MRLGLLSTANINRQILVGARGAGQVDVVAVGSRDGAKAQTYAGEHGIAKAHGSYEALLEDTDVDAVYISLPNGMHHEWTMRALAAGKHVLCEKPYTRHPAEAVEAFDAAEAAGLVLMEAFMYRHHPQSATIQRLVRDGAVGRVLAVKAVFSFPLADLTNVRALPELDGGALMDVGCYCVKFARMAAGRAPTRVSAAARWAASGVDETLAGTLEYAGGAIAQIACSLATSFNQSAQIIGTDGAIEVEQAFNLRPTLRGRMRVQRGKDSDNVEELAFEPVNQYRLEAEGFARLVAAGHGGHGLPEMPLAETLDNMATIDALLRSARTGQPVEVER